jgi:hypothetical protein
LPFRFNRFAVAGTLTNYSGVFEGGTAKVRPELLGVDTREMPLDQQVLSFSWVGQDGRLSDREGG